MVSHIYRKMKMVGSFYHLFLEIKRGKKGQNWGENGSLSRNHFCNNYRN